MSEHGKADCWECISRRLHNKGFVLTCGHEKADEIAATATKEIGSVYLGDCKYFERVD